LFRLVFQTHHGSQKVLSTAVFLYFACLLPSIAFGVLNSQATHNQISMFRIISSSKRKTISHERKRNFHMIKIDLNEKIILLSRDCHLLFSFLGVSKAVASQCLGGIFFSLFAGQPLIVVMTTAPLTLYVKGKSNP